MSWLSKWNLFHSRAACSNRPVIWWRQSHLELSIWRSCVNWAVIDWWLLTCTNHKSHVQITGQNTSTTVVGFHSNGAILFGITELIIEGLDFIGANIGPQKSHQGLIIEGAHDMFTSRTATSWTLYYRTLAKISPPFSARTLGITLYRSNCCKYYNNNGAVISLSILINVDIGLLW